MICIYGVLTWMVADMAFWYSEMTWWHVIVNLVHSQLDYPCGLDQVRADLGANSCLCSIILTVQSGPSLASFVSIILVWDPLGSHVDPGLTGTDDITRAIVVSKPDVTQCSPTHIGMSEPSHVELPLVPRQAVWKIYIYIRSFQRYMRTPF